MILFQLILQNLHVFQDSGYIDHCIIVLEQLFESTSVSVNNKYFIH